MIHLNYPHHEFYGILEWLGDQWADNATEGTDVGARYMRQIANLSTRKES